jgi:hypothetical protein
MVTPQPLISQLDTDGYSRNIPSDCAFFEYLLRNFHLRRLFYRCRYKKKRERGWTELSWKNETQQFAFESDRRRLCNRKPSLPTIPVRRNKTRLRNGVLYPALPCFFSQKN